MEKELDIFVSSVIKFWFSQEVQPLWFKKDPKLDAYIYNQFYEFYERANSGFFDKAQESIEGALALIITLDQFPRNMFRDTPKAFLSDKKALEICEKAIKKGLNTLLIDEVHQLFFYMPYMHSEDLKDQKKGLVYFARLGEAYHAYQYARAHHDIIERFGRFPHRNIALGRPSTVEEINFLKEPFSSF